MPKEKENIWNVPNALTMIRFLLIPVWMVITEIRNRGDCGATSAMIDELKRF